MTATLTYLTVDSIQRGVGASQVLPYVRGIAEAGVAARLHTFEQGRVAPRLSADLGDHIEWHPHRFGSAGPLGGLGRVVRGALAIRGASLVHARSDLAAASALLARTHRWVWDIRSFWVDQRIALGMTIQGSRSERAMRSIERRAARRSSAITTLTAAAIPELARRHGGGVADKAQVVSTCVDLDRFAFSPLPDGPVRLLLSGTFNALYDTEAMLRFHRAVRRLQAATGLSLLRTAATAFDEQVKAQGGEVGMSAFADMPAAVASHHAGLSICRSDQPAALVAAMPTKIGELLACGRPVVASAGLGDVDTLLGETGAGVVLRGTSDGDLVRGAQELVELLADQATPQRCRRVAEEHFSLVRAVDTLVGIYRSLG